MKVNQRGEVTKIAIRARIKYWRTQASVIYEVSADYSFDPIYHLFGKLICTNIYSNGWLQP